MKLIKSTNTGEIHEDIGLGWYILGWQKDEESHASITAISMYMLPLYIYIYIFDEGTIQFYI